MTTNENFGSRTEDVRNWEEERIKYMELSGNTNDNVTREMISVEYENK